MNAEQLEKGSRLLEEITNCCHTLAVWQQIRDRRNWKSAVMRNRLGPEAYYLGEGDMYNIADIMVKALSRKHQELIDEFASL